MSDDLKRRLRGAAEYEPLGHDGWEAYDRIEELEAERDEWRSLAEAAVRDDASKNIYYAELQAKLAKAVKALEEAVYMLAPDERDMMKKAGVYRAVTALAELKGETNE